MQRWYENKRHDRRDDPEDRFSSSYPHSSRGQALRKQGPMPRIPGACLSLPQPAPDPIRGTRSGGPDPGFAGMPTGGDRQGRHSHTKRGRLPVVLGLVALGVLLGAGLLTLAVAQSGRSALSLNSPASFPVDI